MLTVSIVTFLVMILPFIIFYLYKIIKIPAESITSPSFEEDVAQVGKFFELTTVSAASSRASHPPPYGIT